MLTPGALWLRFQQRFGKGLRVAYARDVLRPKILKTPPWHCAASGPVELHVLTSKGDWLNLFWSLKSFAFHAQRDFPICIHEDGSLPPQAIAAIQSHFPNARLIQRHQSDAEMASTLARFPRIAAFRQRHPLAIKVFDFDFYLRAPRMFLFDSDLIFFAAPTALIDRLDAPEYALNCVNGDIDSAYNITPAIAAQRFNIDIVERFNSGFGLIHKASMDWDAFEAFLGYEGIFEHHWRTEQTLFALASSRFGCELLPEDYTVYRGPRNLSFPMRHYVGEIRHLMYREGMTAAARQGLLKAFPTQ